MPTRLRAALLPKPGLARAVARWAAGIGLARWVVVCGALHVLLRVPFLGLPLGIDEGGYAYVARDWAQGAGTSLYGDSWIDRSPALIGAYRMAMAVGAELGSPELGIRLLGLVCGLAGVVACTLVARELVGRRAARVAALCAALLFAAPAVKANFSYAELLAAAPATFSIWFLLRGARATTRVPQATAWAAGAGALATLAVLMKQSSLGCAIVALAVAGVVLLVQRARLKVAAAAGGYVAGFATVWLAVAAWALQGQGVGELLYALFGFRADAIGALAQNRATPLVQGAQLVGLLMAAGILPLLIVSIARLDRVLRDHGAIACATLSAWLAGDAVGVFAGGSYWSHYGVQLIPVATVAGAIGLAWTRQRIAIVSALAAIAVVQAVGFLALLQFEPFEEGSLRTAAAVRTMAQPDDTLYVLYARANVLHYSGLRSPYPYNWSLMVRARPGARQQLLQLLRSPRRPDWIVAWQSPRSWGLDGDARVVSRTLAFRYRRVTTVCGRPIYQRNDTRVVGRPPLAALCAWS